MKAALIVCTLAALVCAAYSWHVPRVPACPPVDWRYQATFLPDRFDCASYFECSNGQAIKMHCPTGLYFDILLKTCNYPDQVKCWHREVPPAQPENV